MKLTQAAPGYYWHTDDPADLPLNEHGPVPPTVLHAYQIGSSVEHESGAELVPVDLGAMSYMGAGIFGEGRLSDPTSITRWTGRSHRFAIYGYVEPFRRPQVVILRYCGTGLQAFILREIDAANTWAELCARLTPELLWDVCRTLTATYQRGCHVEHGRMADLLFAGKIKIKKQRNGPRRLVEVA